MPDESKRVPELSLVFSDGSGRPVVFPIPEGRCAVGSAADNDLVLTDPSVVAHQVVLERVGERLNLLDLFAGETRINDESRRNGQVSPGDVLRLGEVRLRIMKVAPSRTSRLARSSAGTQALREASTAPGSGAQARSRSVGTKVGLSRTPASLEADPPTRKGGEIRARSNTTRAPREPQTGDAKRARERDARRARSLARARQLADEIMPEDDFERVFEKLANGFLDVFSADRAVTVLFEEDGINPLMVVERRRDGTAEGTGVAQEIVNRCLQVRSVIRVAGGYEGLGGLAAPLLAPEGRAMGLLYFERMAAPGHALGADDVHIMALMANVASLKIAPLIS